MANGCGDLHSARQMSAKRGASNVSRIFSASLLSHLTSTSRRNTAMSFAKVAQKLALWAGSPKTFLGALVLLSAWALSGPFFHFNDTWQLIINTSTTIITFLMVFLIQNTQNRDTDILHLKIDELLRASKHAQNAMLGLESLDLKQLEALRKHYQAMGESEAASLGIEHGLKPKNKIDLNQC
jgi:low affinity Fe/Cu permease